MRKSEFRSEELPGSLVPEFLSQVPLDPYDDQVLRYIREGTRVAVYSIGQNQQDDGGSEQKTAKGPGLVKADVVFTLRKTPTTPGEQ